MNNPFDSMFNSIMSQPAQPMQPQSGGMRTYNVPFPMKNQYASDQEYVNAMNSYQPGGQENVDYDKIMRMLAIQNQQLDPTGMQIGMSAARDYQPASLPGLMSMANANQPRPSGPVGSGYQNPYIMSLMGV